MSEVLPQSGPASPEHLFAMFLKLDEQKCLVVGGGSIAEGKVRQLLAAGAEVTLVAPDAIPQLASLAAAGRLVWHAREYRSSDLDGVFLAIGATDNLSLNARVFTESDSRGILCNAVDDPAHCHFYFPSVVDRGPLQIAISTTGQSPALAQRLRQELGRLYGEEYASWVRYLGTFRERLFADTQLDPEHRKQLLHQEASDSAFRDFLRENKRSTPGNSVESRSASGKVYLVGAGPGDPELLTVKAVRLLSAADVVLHDDLVGAEILEMVPSGAEIRNVGKRAGGKHTPQAEINDLMIASARAGKRVVRLKGGDPMLFGRAGEEMDALRAAGIRFEVVPGITAALGAAAAAKISLTDRRLASSVLFASGHACVGNAVTDWAAAIRTGATIVIYMPGDHLQLAALLLEAGTDGNTPCAVVAQASLPGEHLEFTSLQHLSEAAQTAKPNLLIVGPVVASALARKEEGKDAAAESASQKLRQNSNEEHLATR
ncbi:MAG: siroheme synthase CysG [Candidatus Korobacteraceae bacterium]